MGVLSELQPKDVFKYFEEITQIPRPSYHEKAISDYLVKFAKDRGLEVYQDDIYNVIMIKEASEGYEDQEPIILQGHMDMVCEKNPGVEKDMEHEGLDLYIDGDYVRAKGTTLGGDDGIAVAYALALLDDDTLKHPRLEFVCTVSEEVGMDGAQAIDCSPLKGHILLNMDSENEGVVLAGCAGGGCANITLPVKREASTVNQKSIKVTGLTGGHSGTEINKGRANSLFTMTRIFRYLSAADPDFRIITLSSGSKDNAIPRESIAVISTSLADDKFEEIIRNAEKALKDEYSASDPDLTVEISDSDSKVSPLDKASSANVIALLSSVPNGVQRMSDNVEGLVETSLNWGVSDLHYNELNMKAAVRSSVGTAFDSLISQISCITAYHGAEFKVTGAYPAWEWVKESVLRDRMQKIYKDMFGKDLVIEAIHAGVECGLLAGKIKNLDAISMGPNIIDIHTPNEHLSISSVKRMYDFIKAVVSYKE